MTRKWIELVFNFNMGSLQIWLNIGFEVCTLDKPIKQHDYIPLGLSCKCLTSMIYPCK